MSETKDKLVKLAEAAEMIGLPPIALWRLCRRGHVRHIRIGRCYYLSISTVQGLLDAASTNAEASR